MYTEFLPSYFTTQLLTLDRTIRLYSPFLLCPWGNYYNLFILYGQCHS